MVWSYVRSEWECLCKRTVPHSARDKASVRRTLVITVLCRTEILVTTSCGLCGKSRCFLRVCIGSVCPYCIVGPPSSPFTARNASSCWQLSGCGRQMDQGKHRGLGRALPTSHPILPLTSHRATLPRPRSSDLPCHRCHPVARRTQGCSSRLGPFKIRSGSATRQ